MPPRTTTHRRLPPHIVRIAFVPRICSTAHGLVFAQLGTDARCVQRLMLYLYESCLRRQTAHPTLHNPLKLISGVPSLLTHFASTALLQLPIAGAFALHSPKSCAQTTRRLTKVLTSLNVKMSQHLAIPSAETKKINKCQRSFSLTDVRHVASPAYTHKRLELGLPLSTTIHSFLHNSANYIRIPFNHS